VLDNLYAVADNRGIPETGEIGQGRRYRQMPEPINEPPNPQTIGDRLPDDAEVIDGLIVIGDEAWTPAEWVLEHPIQTRHLSEEAKEEAKRLQNRMAQRRFQQRRRVINVERVLVDPQFAVGIGIGTVDDGSTEVVFAGDSDVLSALGETLQQGAAGVDVAGFSEWTVVLRRKRNP
jgi:hypothetical protein